MIYDQKTFRIRIRNMLGMSEFEFYQILSHEILHWALHRVMGIDMCLKLDSLSNEVDGRYAFVWMGEDWRATELDLTSGTREDL